MARLSVASRDELFLKNDVQTGLKFKKNSYIALVVLKEDSILHVLFFSL